MQKNKQFKAKRLRLLPLILAATLGLAGCSPGISGATGPVRATTPTAVSANLGTVPDTPILAPTATPSVTVAISTTVANPESVALNFDPEQVTITLQPTIEGLDQPLFVTHANDNSGRLFVVEKGGTIQIYQAGALLSTPFLDIQDRVGSNGSEQGLLGLAFAPNYATGGHFFVNYTDQKGDTVIARFQVTADDSNLADAASEFLVLAIDQPAANHNGGMLAFGPDGYLYVGMGDGGGGGDRFGNGQNPETLLGKFLRLDVTGDLAQPYLIPADNPWVNADWNGVDVRDEVWAVGLRNPWRFSFDRATGDLWTGDVGQNQYEEINFTLAGSAGVLNYGWPIMEGLHCFRGNADCETDDLVSPVAEYEHSSGCSVTGGYVYRGAQFVVLQGVYFYGDYCTGVLWAAWPAGQVGWRTAQVADTDQLLSSFGEDEAGELYVTDLNAGTVAQVVLQGK